MLDPASSLYYFNARVYDPSIMRFTTKDPPPGSQSNLASPTCGGSSHCATTSNPTCTQGAANSNLYAYAADNPLTNTDPTGMQIFTCENICIAIITITIAIVCIIFIVSIEFCVAFAPIITENVDYICTFVCGFFG